MVVGAAVEGCCVMLHVSTRCSLSLALSPAPAHPPNLASVLFGCHSLTESSIVRYSNGSMCVYMDGWMDG